MDEVGIEITIRRNGEQPWTFCTSATSLSAVGGLHERYLREYFMRIGTDALQFALDKLFEDKLPRELAPGSGQAADLMRQVR